MKNKELTEKEQKKLFRKGRLSKKDFAKIYELYHKKVYDFTYRRVSDQHVAEDLTGQIFEKIIKSIDDFQWQGITVSAWIFRIARNSVIDHYRKNNKYKGSVSLDLVSDFLEGSEESTIEDMIDDLEYKNLYDAIREFREEDQYLIYYKYFEDLSNKRIAKLMKLSETNIGTKLHRIRKKLRKYIDQVKNK